MKRENWLGKTFKTGFKHRLFLQYTFSALRKIGLLFSLYYINQEMLIDGIKIKVDSSIEPVAFGLLTPEEIEDIFKNPETKDYAVNREAIKKDNVLCAALKHNHEVMAFVFVNLTRCRSLITSFNLKDNEAYLYNQFTYYNYRGKNLAPYLRQEMYRYLLSIGRTRLYSITEYFNASAKAFKSKLQAKPIKLGICVKLFNLWEFNFTLRNYLSLEAQSEAIDYARMP